MRNLQNLGYMRISALTFRINTLERLMEDYTQYHNIRLRYT